MLAGPAEGVSNVLKTALPQMSSNHDSTPPLFIKAKRVRKPLVEASQYSLGL